MKIFSSCFIVVFLAIFGVSCDGGLDPTQAAVQSSANARISGTITYLGGISSWPSADSLMSIRVVAFKKYPSENIGTELLNGNAIYTPETLSFRVASQEYTLDIANPPVEFNYIVVAQQYGADDAKDWRAIGIFTRTGDVNVPSPVKVEMGRVYNDIDIFVDFSNLPPDPFE